MLSTRYWHDDHVGWAICVKGANDKPREVEQTMPVLISREASDWLLVVTVAGWNKRGETKTAHRPAGVCEGIEPRGEEVRE